MTSAYPGAIDDFSESSPTYMSDPDATGRVHSARHDDVESAIEQVEETLGVNPQGTSTTVAERIRGGQWYGGAWAHDADDTFFRSVGMVNLARINAQGVQNLSGSMSDSGRRVATHYWDESVGRRLFMWDTINARWQMVYGDTGLRAITALDNGYTGTVWVRRLGSMVTCYMNVTMPSSGSAVLTSMPDGFHPEQRAFSVGWNGTTGQKMLGLVANDLNIYETITVGQVVQISWTFSTAQPWPGALPGTAVGAIPTADTLLPDDYTPDVDPDIPTGLSPDDDTSGWTVAYPDGPTP